MAVKSAAASAVMHAGGDLSTSRAHHPSAGDNTTEKIFLPNGEEGFKNGDTLYLYYGNLKCLGDINNCYGVHSVTCLIVIGQPLSDLFGVGSLHSLNELWIVECSLKDISEVSSCKNLKRLYLYSNYIEVVPNLNKLNSLEVLWLSNNEISRLENANIPRNLQELHIADNKIPSIQSRCFDKTVIKSLNLSGNPINCFKVLDSLMGLSTLRSLVFSDPMYKTSPLCYINNYRSYTIYMLPQLQQLDLSVITREERILTQEFYEDTLFYYRVLKNQLSAKHYKDLTVSTVHEQTELEPIRRSIFELMEKQQKIILEYEDDNHRKQICVENIEQKKKFLLAKAGKILMKTNSERNLNLLRYQAELDKMEFELRNIGKYVFKHYEMNSMLGKICQKLLNEFTCCYMKRDLHVKSAELFRVTHIYNSDCPKFNNHYDDSLRFYILASPVPITDLKQWSFSTLEQFLTQPVNEETLFTLTDCIFCGDASLLDNRMTDPSYSARVALIVYTRNRKEKFVKSTLLTCHGAAHQHNRVLKQCNKHQIKPSDVVPSFIIEFSYIQGTLTIAKSHVKNANKNVLKFTPTPSIHIAKTIADDVFNCTYNNDDDDYDYEDDDVGDMLSNSRDDLYKSCGDSYYKQYRDIVTTDVSLECVIRNIFDWKTLTNLSLPSSNISSFGDAKTVQLVNVDNLNLSGNYLSGLQELGCMFPNVKYLNASFNIISTLSFSQVLNKLEGLDISWNRINRLVVVLLQLKSNAPALTRLDVQYNPVMDIHSLDHTQQFVKKYLTELIQFNESYINKSDAFQSATYNEIRNKVNHALCRTNFTTALTLHWTCELCLLKDKSAIIGSLPHIGYDFQNGKLICVSAKKLTHFYNSLNTIPGVENVCYVDLSCTALDYAHCLRILKKIEEMNLSNNLLRFIGMSFTGMSCLVKLDLSYNYLTSLRDLSETDLLSLKILDVSCNRIASFCGIDRCPNLQELYASHNCLFTLDSLKAMKNLLMLRAISLHHNPVEEDPLFRFFLVFHLHDLEYINGIRIDEEEEAAANEEYSGVIDTDYLLKELSGIQLPRLTKLALPKCSIKEINLDNCCLVNLKMLDLEYNNITSLKGLAALPSLEILNLGWNKIVSFFIAPEANENKDEKNKKDSDNNRTVVRYENEELVDFPDEAAISEMVGGKNVAPIVEPKEEFPVLDIRPVLDSENLSKDANRNKSKKAPVSKKSNVAVECQERNCKCFQELKVLLLHSNRITSLEPLQLSLFPKLSTLMLQDNDLLYVSGLNGVKTLQNLILDKNKIMTVPPEEVDDVATTLIELYLEGNNLKSIKFLKKCLKLKKLFLAQNRIQEIQEVKHLDNLGLQELTLWGNAIARNYNYNNLVLECLPDLKRFDGVYLQNSDQEKSTVGPKKKREASFFGDSNSHSNE